MLGISINQQGERLRNYRNHENEVFDAARFNIILIYQPANAPMELIKCENGVWMQTSLILHRVKGLEGLRKGMYTVIVMALWNDIAL